MLAMAVAMATYRIYAMAIAMAIAMAYILYVDAVVEREYCAVVVKPLRQLRTGGPKVPPWKPP